MLNDEVILNLASKLKSNNIWPLYGQKTLWLKISLTRAPPGYLAERAPLGGGDRFRLAA